MSSVEDDRKSFSVLCTEQAAIFSTSKRDVLDRIQESFGKFPAVFPSSGTKAQSHFFASDLEIPESTRTFFLIFTRFSAKDHLTILIKSDVTLE